MALKDKLMTLEDFKAVRDVDVASNSAQFTEIKADLDEKLSAFTDFFIHLNGTFDDGNGDQYIQKILDAINPFRQLTLSPNGFSPSSTHLYIDEGNTRQTSLTSSGAIYYYLNEKVQDTTTYLVRITISASINTHSYKAVYAYKSELLSGAGTSDPTIYNITNMETDGIVNAQANPLTEDYVYETQVTVKSGRFLAIEFYRDQASFLTVEAKKVVN